MSDFLAEAQVLIRPNTAGFATVLRAELEAIVKSIPPVAVPVTAVAAPGAAAATQAITAATREQAAATQVAGVAAATAASSQTSLTRAQAAGAAAAKSLAFAQSEVKIASSEAAAARITATRAVTAAVVAEEAFTAALIAGDAATIKMASDQLKLAAAFEAESIAAAKAARSTATLATAEGAAARGAGSALLSMVGLRGATLAATAPFLAGAASAVVFAKAVQVAARTEQELNTFQAVAGATADEMQRVAEAARELGADVQLPGVAAGDAAQAMTELAKAGLDVENSIDGARGVLLLATAAQIDNAAATELTANALNAFGLAGEDATKVADLLAGASLEAQGSITDMGIALQQSAAVARQVGLSLDDTVTFITLLAKNGLRASDAGTSLRTAFIRLINPTSKARDLINELGIKVRDLAGNVRADVFAQFTQATQDMGAAQRDAALAVIFGQDAIRAAAILAREGADGFNLAAGAITEEGIAAEVAAARTKGLSGQAGVLSSNMETLAGTIGGAVLPALTHLVTGLAEVFGGINNAISATRSFRDELRKGDFEIPGLTQTEGFFDRISSNLREISNLPGLADLREGVRGLGGDVGSTGDISAKAAGQVDTLFRSTVNLDSALGRLASGQEATTAAEDLFKATVDLNLVLPRLAANALFAGGAFNTLNDSLLKASASLERQIHVQQTVVLETQVSGDPREERAALEKLKSILEERRKKLEAIIAQDGTGAATARETLLPDTLRQLDQVIDSIAAIDSAAVSKAEAAAREAEANAKKIADARLAAQKAISDAIGARVTARENAVLRAQATQGLRDDLAANVLLRSTILAGIDSLRNIIARTVEEAKQKATAIANLVRQLIQVQNTIGDLRRQAAQERQRLAEDTRQRAVDIANARVELAQATGNRQAEIAARKAAIAALEAQIRAHKGETLKILQLRTAIAEQRKALKELTDEVEDRQKAFQELSFQFLQQQQGFAANLLGNLIPGGATSGLVGGGGGSQTQVSLPSQVAALPKPDVGIGVEAGIQGSRGGVTQTQFSVLIDLTRQMVRILQGARSDVQAPEARYNTSTGRASMDSIPFQGGV